MNEDELKNIWRQEEKIPLKNIDMEWIGQQTLLSKNELQRKLKWDVTMNVLSYVIFVPFAFYDPKVLFLIPFAAAVWIWYLWEIRRLYKYEAVFQNVENVKSFLTGKEKLLSGYLTRSRYIAYIGAPITWTSVFAMGFSFGGILDSNLSLLIFLIFNELIVAAMIEYYIRKIYAPVLDELRDLLRQLDDGNS